MKKVRFADEMNSFEFVKNSDPAKKIESIQFSLLRATDVQKSSQIPIYDRQIYNLDQPSVPARGGPLDLRMVIQISMISQGISEKGKICETCKKALADCPGHFGYVKLELPVFHVGYFKYVVNILQCVCKECCGVLLDDEERIKYLKQMRARKDPLQ